MCQYLSFVRIPMTLFDEMYELFLPIELVCYCVADTRL